MPPAIHLLVIEDTPSDYLLLTRALRAAVQPMLCEQVSTAEQLAAALARRRWDAVLSDFNVPGMVFERTLRRLRAELPELPVILVSGTVGEEKAVELLRLGVTDFVLKGNLARLIPSIERALREADELRARRQAEQALFEKDQLLREMSSLAHIGGWDYEIASGRFSWTEELARIHAVAAASWLPLAELLALFEPAQRARIEALFAQASTTGAPFDAELELANAGGVRKWLRMVGVALFDGAKVVRLRGAMQDISDRKRSELMLAEQKERAEVTLHAIGDAVISTDARGHIDYLNPVAEALSGWPLAQAVGRAHEQVLTLVDELGGQPLASALAAVLTGEGRGHSRTGMLVARDGRRIPVEESAAPIVRRDGVLAGAVLVLHDMRLARELSAKLAFQATHDALTGLPNRTLARDRLEQAISVARREGHHVGVLFLDLDRFKNINDSLGHVNGDDILTQVATRLLAVTRAGDTVSRQGGDEFIMIIPSVHQLRHFSDLADKIQRAVAVPYRVHQHELNVTFSIGISIYPNDGSGATELIKNADAAMYFAKESGRNNYQFYAREMNNQGAGKLTLEVQMRHGVTRGEFIVHYQPKVDAAAGTVIGAEALARWNHPQSGMLAPSNFIGLAEETGLILPIGQGIMQLVCHQSRRWQHAGLPDVPVSVNLSAVQFRDKALVQSLRALFAETGLPPRLFELELTESIIMHDSEHVIATLHQLKDLGISLSIDDFGTGYSSLSYLKRFPIDTLKIDQAFVRDLAADDADGAIVKAIIALAHSLRMRVVAEGVETASQLSFLRAHQCDAIQGNYFSAALPAEAFARLLAEPHAGD